MLIIMIVITIFIVFVIFVKAQSQVVVLTLRNYKHKVTLERSTDWSWEDALAIHKPHSKNLKLNVHFNGNRVDPIDCEMKYCNSFLI